MLRFHKKKFSSAIFDKKNDEKNDKKQNEQKSWELTVWITDGLTTRFTNFSHHLFLLNFLIFKQI